MFGTAVLGFDKLSKFEKECAASDSVQKKNRKRLLINLLHHFRTIFIKINNNNNNEHEHNPPYNRGKKKL